MHVSTQGLVTALIVAILFFDLLMTGASVFIRFLKEDEARTQRLSQSQSRKESELEPTHRAA
jgi:hypothetical protein